MPWPLCRLPIPLGWAALLFCGALSAQETGSAAISPPPVPATQVSTEILDRAVVVGVEMAQNAAASSQRVSVIADETEDLLQQYRLVLRELEAVNTYNEQMAEINRSQEDEIGLVEKDLGQLQATRREIIPLLLRMIDTLDEFISRDTPFLLEERRERVARLREIMDRGDVNLAEKFRNVFEAYQFENDLGRTVEGYRAPITLDGREVTVEFFRFGRVALYYQTLDGAQTGWWNPASRGFESLSGDLARVSINQALKIANNQAPKNLMNLPLPAPSVLP